MKRKLTLLQIWWRRFSQLKYMQILGNALNGFGDDKIHKLSASLAYTTIFSLAPMLVLIILAGSLLAEKSAIEGRVIADLGAFIGENMARFIENLILQISFKKDTTTIATVVSSVLLIVLATGLFVEIQDSLNMIWGVRPKRKKGFIKLLSARLISFVGIIIFGLILALMIMLNTIFNVLSKELVALIPLLPVDTIAWLNTAFLLVFMTLFFGMLYKLLPDVTIKWKDVWGGALITTILFLISKWLISMFISRNTTVSIYGAASSVVILMLWIYCSAFIFYFGAEFIRAVAEYKGRIIKPKIYAELAEKRLIQVLRDKYRALQKEKKEWMNSKNNDDSERPQ